MNEIAKLRERIEDLQEELDETLIDCEIEKRSQDVAETRAQERDEEKQKVKELREELEGPLAAAETKILEEKSLLLLVYESLTGSSSIDGRLSNLSTAYTIGYLSEHLPGFAQTITTSDGTKASNYV